MKFIYVLIVIMTGALFAFSAHAAPAGGDYGLPRVIIQAPADSRFAHLSWPKIVRAVDGSLIVAYIAGRKHVNGDGCPAVSVSRDDGKSFSRPEIIMEFDRTKKYQHCGNVALGVAGDGAVVLIAMVFTDNERNNIYGWRSSDSGKTWQQVDTSSLGDNRTGSVFGHIFGAGGKGLAVCGHYRKPAGDGIWISYSLDEGRKWGPPLTITSRRLFEPAFIYAQGRFVGLVRENKAHAYHQFYSDDQGETWKGSELVLQGDAAVHPSPFITVDPVNPSKLYALQSQRTKTGEIFLWTADVRTLQWKRLGLVASFPGCEDYSYPWMIHLQDKEWFAVFYAGMRDGQNSIYGMKLTIPIEPAR